MAELCASPATACTRPRSGPRSRSRIDTGRRPEDILRLPVDCLARDTDGAAVLVYDNAKADRLGRRLPISQATAAVITAQQARVRARFPDTPLGELKLLPSPRRNPDGRRPISSAMLDAAAPDLGRPGCGLRTADGTEFDKARIVPYAYRHTYAQRHADAGVPIDVLAELLDHRNLNVTRRYYRVGEDRRRAAVDTVTAMSFDRHGNRIWRDAARPAGLRARPLRRRRGRRPLRALHRTVQRRRPAAAPARSGSAAPAATTSAPTSPTCPT